MSGCTADKAPAGTGEAASVLFVQEGVFVVYRCRPGYHFTQDDEGISWCDQETGQWGPVLGVCVEIPTTAATETTTLPPTTTTTQPTATTTTVPPTTTTATEPPITTPTAPPTAPSTTPPTTTPPTTTITTTVPPIPSPLPTTTATMAQTSVTTPGEPSTMTTPVELGDCTGLLAPTPDTATMVFLQEGLFIIYNCTGSPQQNHVTWCTDARTWDEVPICPEPTTPPPTTTAQPTTTTRPPSTTTQQPTTTTQPPSTTTKPPTTTTKPPTTTTNPPTTTTTTPPPDQTTEQRPLGPQTTSAPITMTNTGSTVSVLPATTAVGPIAATGGLSAGLMVIVAFAVLSVVLIALIIALWCWYRCRRRRRRSPTATKDPLVPVSDRSSRHSEELPSITPVSSIYSYAPHLLGPGKKVAIDTNRNQFVTVVEVDSGQVNLPPMLPTGEIRISEARHGSNWADITSEESSGIYHELGMVGNLNSSVRGNYSRRISNGGGGGFQREAMPLPNPHTHTRAKSEPDNNTSSSTFPRNHSETNAYGTRRSGTHSEPDDSQRRGTGTFAQNTATGNSARGNGTGSILRNRDSSTGRSPRNKGKKDVKRRNHLRRGSLGGGLGDRNSATSSSMRESESSSLPSSLRVGMRGGSSGAHFPHDFVPHALTNTRRTNTPLATPKLMRA